MADQGRATATEATKRKRKPPYEASLPTEDATNPVSIAFGIRLRKIRLAQDISQDVLADISTIHRTEISLLERGQREPRIGIVIKLAKALRVPVSDLTTDLVEYEPPTQEELRAYHFPPKGTVKPTKPNGTFTIIR